MSQGNPAKKPWEPSPAALDVKRLIDETALWGCLSVDHSKGGYIFYLRTKESRRYLDLLGETVMRKYALPVWCADQLVSAPADARDAIIRYAFKELSEAVRCATSR